MKTIQIFLITLAIVVFDAKNNLHHRKNTQPSDGAGYGSPVDTTISHIRDFTQGNINNAAMDRHPLWNNLSNNNLYKPFYHGVVGPTYRPQNVELNNGKSMIASPMPKPEHYNRVIANEYPNRTFSKSFHFDLPLREEVQGINIPNQITRVTTERFDPRHPLKQLVDTFSGTLVHNSGSANERIVVGQPNFLQKSAKFSTRSGNKKSDPISMIPQELAGHAKAGISHAQAIFDKTTESLNILTNNIAPPLDRSLNAIDDIGTRMIIPIVNANRSETPSLLLNDCPAARQASIDAQKNTLAGIRSLNTFRRMH